MDKMQARGLAPRTLSLTQNFAAHNAAVPVDGQADACACAACAEVNRGPGALVDVRHRGPLQCEGVSHDPLDALAMAEIEGARPLACLPLAERIRLDVVADKLGRRR